MKENCWKFKKCGREPGGKNVNELGICLATTETRTDGINHGKNGGRSCWAIAATLCGSEVQGSFAQKIDNCSKCEFYLQVRKEERTIGYQSAKEILQILRKNNN